MVANAVSIPTECCPKISKLMKRNWPGAKRIQFINGNHGFYNGAKPKKFKLTFWAEKSTNIVLEYNKICGRSTFGGLCFLRKAHFVYIFMRKS